uniref:F-box domain-containing protein n=1 Tax=Araucaria cunninghamii TaxID=56994 RepID=A0A0D6R8D6_ARACU
MAPKRGCSEFVEGCSGDCTLCVLCFVPNAKKFKKGASIMENNSPESYELFTLIMDRIPPGHVCALSSASKACKVAGDSDFVWEGKLPPKYPILLQRADEPLNLDIPKRELYFRLCNPISIDNGKKKFWLDKATGTTCFMLSARDLHITVAGNNQSWRWISQGASSFNELAKLKAVSKLKVEGQFDCNFLTPGIPYTVSFKLKLETPRGWCKQPVKFEITPPCRDHEVSALYLQRKMRPVKRFKKASYRYIEDGWMECIAGEFVVEEKDGSPKEVKFCMREWDGAKWKGGLLLDGVKIQPSFVVTKGNIVY